MKRGLLLVATIPLLLAGGWLGYEIAFQGLLWLIVGFALCGVWFCYLGFRYARRARHAT